MGCFPLEKLEHRLWAFLQQASQFLEHNHWVGVFLVRAQPMVNLTQPLAIGKFYKGFAHLALWTSVKQAAPRLLAIASQEEIVHSVIPLGWLLLFDPSEPLFEQMGWHPMVIHRRVVVLVGHSSWITQKQL
ncbi:hypothetical protein [Moorena sp. SIOASIH]|uniref:hypothetical protein n=1 Tax=Moorena sp. SIOASIH TaxID=2607817 RepID=UPI0025DE82F7|nr:hypothetical protein [Moorena sp. SIOASIH]